MGDFLTDYAKELIDLVDDLYVEVDGQAVQNPWGYRGASGPIRFTGDPSLMDTFDPCITGTEQDGASDGYWIMLAPLPTGDHMIRFRAGVSALDFLVEVTYNLHVGPHALGTTVSTEAPSMNSGSSASLKQKVLEVGSPLLAPAQRATWGGLKILYR